MNENIKSSEGVAQIQKILNFAKDKSFKKEEYIFKEGQEDKSFYMLIDGEVLITKNTSEGSEKEIARLKPGEFLGEGVFSGIFIKPASAKATKDVKMLAFAKEDFDKMIEEDSRAGVDFLTSILGVMHHRLNKSNIKLLTLSEINKLISIHQDDLSGLSKGIIHKMITITKSEEGVILIKNQFNNSYRVIYKTDKDLDKNLIDQSKLLEPEIINDDKNRTMIVPMENVGIIAFSRSITSRPYDDADLRLCILVAGQVANAIESASRRASDKAKNILNQKRFTL